MERGWGGQLDAMVSSKRVLCVLLSSSFNPFLLALLLKRLQAFIHHHMTDRSDDFLCSHEFFIFFVNFNFAKRHLWENKILVMVSRDVWSQRKVSGFSGFVRSITSTDGQWTMKYHLPNGGIFLNEFSTPSVRMEKPAILTPNVLFGHLFN